MNAVFHHQHIVLHLVGALRALGYIKQAHDGGEWSAKIVRSAIYKTIEFAVGLGKHLVALHKLYSVVMIQADEQIYSHGNRWQCNGKVQHKV